MNTGSKKWKHVMLVHLSGFKPICNEVYVPDIKPGESVELVAQFPALGEGDPDIIKR